MVMKAWLAPLFMGLVLFIASCEVGRHSPPLSQTAQSLPPDASTFCAAIRGNGNLVFTHFGALSRVIEEWGELQGMAGGSSASITTFFYESMLLNPALPTDPAERRETLALMLKSVLGYAEIVGRTPEGEALTYVGSISRKVRRQGLLSLVKTNWWEAARKLRQILAAPEIRQLINPEAMKMLANIDHTGYRSYAFKVEELIKGASVIDGFRPEEPGMFFREPILNYDGFTHVLGEIGDFYAGLEPEVNDLFQEFLEACAPLSSSLTWDQLAPQQTGKGTCGTLLAKAVLAHVEHVRQEGRTSIAKPTRLDDVIGKHLLAFVPVAVLEGRTAVETYERSLKSYRRQKKADLPVRFSDVRFGYFSPFPTGQSHLDRMRELFPENAKVGKSINLNPDRPVTWREALRYSTLEPGLSRIVPIGADRAYIGGWADLQPTQVLRAAGCDRIIYINRIGAETTFITTQHALTEVPMSQPYGVAEWLNMTAEEYRLLYDMNNPENAYNQSVREADAVWCTDWDSAEQYEMSYMFDHSYGLTPSLRGGHKGHMTGIALRDGGRSPFKVSEKVPIIDNPFWGCHAP